MELMFFVCTWLGVYFNVTLGGQLHLLFVCCGRARWGTNSCTHKRFWRDLFMCPLQCANSLPCYINKASCFETSSSVVWFLEESGSLTNYPAVLPPYTTTILRTIQPLIFLASSCGLIKCGGPVYTDKCLVSFMGLARTTPRWRWTRASQAWSTPKVNMMVRVADYRTKIYWEGQRWIRTPRRSWVWIQVSALSYNMIVGSQGLFVQTTLLKDVAGLRLRSWNFRHAFNWAPLAKSSPARVAYRKIIVFV